MDTIHSVPRKIIVAPNAFKGSLSAKAAAWCIEEGIRISLPDADVVSLLVSDGGDGFVQALEFGLKANEYSLVVSGPLGSPVQSSFLYSPEKQIAIIEMAKSSGLALLNPNELDPMGSSTYGVGEMIVAALDLGATHFIIGIGGSATNDGGTGMATALGVRFFDDGGNSIPGNAENLSRIKRIDLSGMDSRLSSVTFDVACDVNNILLGPQGAAAVYGPQKGATPEQVKKIEEGLAQLASVINHDLGKDVRLIEGGGAAGGLGATLYALLNAQIKPGAELLLDILNFDDLLKDADLVITTEGRLDFQTGFGKAPSIVANRAKRLNVPTVIVCGQVESETFNWQAFGFLKVYSLSDSEISTEFAMTHTEKLLIAKSNLLINEFMMAGT